MATRSTGGTGEESRPAGSANAHVMKLGHVEHAGWAMNGFAVDGRTAREVYRDKARAEARAVGKRVAEIVGPWNGPLDVVTVGGKG